MGAMICVMTLQKLTMGHCCMVCSQVGGMHAVSVGSSSKNKR